MRSIVRRLPVRLIWLKVHVWLALTAGFLFVLVGLAGSLSVYREDIDEWLNPQLVIENPQGEWQSLDHIMAAVRKVHPERYGAWTLEMPRTPNSMMVAWYDKPRETYFELYAPLMVSVNPYTAEVVASRFWGQTFGTWVLDVHTQLLMGRSGWNTVGILGVLLGLSVCSGLYLWWPGVAQLGVALRVNYRAGLIKLAFSVHKLTGVAVAPVLLVLAITGFMLSYPALLEKAVGTSGMAHGETGRDIVSTANPTDHPTGLESAEFMARGAFPKSELRRVTTPAGQSGIYRINLRQRGEVNHRHPFTTVWVDRWSGQVKEVRDPFRFTAGETLVTWVWPLHTGEVLSPAIRLLWFLAGPALLFLYVSGVLHWLYRRGKVQDRPLDVVAIRQFMRSAMQKAGQGMVWGVGYAQVAVKRAAPYLGRAVVGLVNTFYKLRAAWFNRQGRIGKL